VKYITFINLLVLYTLIIIKKMGIKAGQASYFILIFLTIAYISLFTNPFF